MIFLSTSKEAKTVHPAVFRYSLLPAYRIVCVSPAQFNVTELLGGSCAR